VRGAAKNAVPDVLKEHAYYEALTWWFTMQGIGQDLKARYEVPIVVIVHLTSAQPK
jgi:hypothetical protein